MKVILKGLHQSPGGADLCAVVAAVTAALQLEGVGAGRGWVAVVGVKSSVWVYLGQRDHCTKST